LRSSRRKIAEEMGWKYDQKRKSMLFLENALHTNCTYITPIRKMKQKEPSSEKTFIDIVQNIDDISIFGISLVLVYLY